MKPETGSQHLLSVTQSKAKMFEYNVPLEDHIKIYTNPDRLFILSIGLLGDIAARINDSDASDDEIQELRNILPFSARFFDTFVETRLNREIDTYVRLLGSAAYYLCNLPGSSKILAERLTNNELNLGMFGLENLLTWFLQSEYSASLPDIPDSPYQPTINSTLAFFQQFNEAGSRTQEVLEAADLLRDTAYTLGTPRELLISDLVGAVIRRRFENSTWNCLSRYSDIPVVEWAEIIRKKTFIKEFWPAQHLLGKKGVFRGKSAVVQMPTSAGKTKATEIIIRSAFLSKRASLVVIVAPFRALCHEIRQNLVKAFQGENISIDELSDVLQIDFTIARLLQGEQVLIVTPEKLHYILRHSVVIAEKIGLIVYDEGHQFDNGTRGITYELLLTDLKTKIPQNTQTILISAVIRNAAQVGEWLIGTDAEVVDGVNLVPTFRSLAFITLQDSPKKHLWFVNQQNPDVQEFYVPRIIQQYSLQLRSGERKERIFPDLADGKEIALFLGLKLASQGSVAIFCGTKPSISNMCKNIVDRFARGLPIPKPGTFSNANAVEIQRLYFLHQMNLGVDAAVTQSAQWGILAHHNNIPHGLRLSIEYAMKEGLVNFIICTSTLAQGVNLPIRYLIVTSVYQGEEPIKVRDFQNLIGRSGRSGMHTEGSILFADPEIYDDRNGDDYQKSRWEKVKTLLDPINSEPCASTLYSIFDPLLSDDKKSTIRMEPFEFVETYLAGSEALGNKIEALVDDDFSLGGLHTQVVWKLNIVAAIESYLMAHADAADPTLNEKEITNLAQGTLAYFLANQEEREQIVKLFLELAQNIIEKIPELEKRVIFGKTLYGVQTSLAISDWISQHVDDLAACNNDSEMLILLWPLLSSNVHNKSFASCDKPEVLLDIAKAWIEGAPFYSLFEMLLAVDAKMIAKTQKRQYRIENAVDICENGLAYDGMLVLGAISELLQLIAIENRENLVNSLSSLQKRMKYGLPTPMSVLIYELGFSDRVVALDLSVVFEDLQPDKEIVFHSLKAREEQVFQVLDKYPFYFSEVYKSLT